MATRPILLKDIRYFATATPPIARAPLYSDAGAPSLAPEVHRFGQRAACLLASMGFASGSADHVCIALTSALDEGEIRLVGAGFERWQYYAVAGVARAVEEQAPAQRLARLREMTFDVLARIAPTQLPLLAEAQRRLVDGGAATRIVRASVETAGYRFEASFDVADQRASSRLHVTATDLASGRTLYAPPWTLADHEDAFALVAALRFSRGILTLVPRRSARADAIVRAHRGPLRIPLARFAPARACAGADLSRRRRGERADPAS